MPRSGGGGHIKEGDAAKDGTGAASAAATALPRMITIMENGPAGLTSSSPFSLNDTYNVGASFHSTAVEIARTDQLEQLAGNREDDDEEEVAEAEAAARAEMNREEEERREDANSVHMGDEDDAIVEYDQDSNRRASHHEDDDDEGESMHRLRCAPPRCPTRHRVRPLRRSGRYRTCTTWLIPV